MANNPYEEAYLGDGGASYMKSFIEVPQQIAQGNPWADQMADKLGTIMQAVPNLVLDPKSQGYPDTLAFLSKVAPDVAKWLTYNVAPPGMVWQSSKNIAETVQDPNMTVGEKIPAVLTDAAVAAMAMAPVQLGKAGAKGLDKLGGYAADLVSGGLNPDATKRVMAALESGNTGELGIYAGQKAKGWDAAEGKFSYLLDTKPRFEIDDSKAVLTGKASGKADEVLSHPDLYKQYPELKSYDIHTAIDPNLRGGSGSTYPGYKTIVAEAPSEKSLRGVLLHEMQHPVQGIERFPSGGSSDMPSPDLLKLESLRDKAFDRYTKLLNKRDDIYNKTLRSSNDVLEAYTKSEAAVPGLESARDLWRTYNDLAQSKSGEKLGYEGYKKLAGEFEARDVASRRDLTKEQRLRTMPYSSEDIPLEDLIVRYGQER